MRRLVPILFLSAVCHGATYYVATTGSDGAAGGSGTPWLTFSHAAATAVAGDTVIFRDGTYGKESQVSPNYAVTLTNSGSAGNVITFRAENRGLAILDCEDTGGGSANGCAAYINFVNTSYILIQGFKIKRGRLEGLHSNDAAHHVTIKWCEIYEIANNGTVGGPGLDGIYLNPTEHHWTFEANSWHDIGRTGATNLDHAIYFSAEDVTITNNVFYNISKGWPIQIAQSAARVLIQNNTFIGLATSGEDGHIQFWSDASGGGTAIADVTVQNNIFSGPLNNALGRFDCTMSGTNLVDHNITTVGGVIASSTGFTIGANQLSTNPLLVSASPTYDFHLQAGSPAIDTGVSAATADYFGVARPISITDIGATEYATSTTTLSIARPPTGKTTGTITLTGACAGPGTETYLWTNVTGPATGVFGAATSTSTTFATSSRGDYEVQLACTNNDGVATASVHVGAVLVDADDIVTTGASEAIDSLLGPLPRMGSSPWTGFDFASPALASAISAAAIANPPHLGAAIPGTCQLLKQFVRCVGTATTYTTDIDTGIDYQITWNTVDGNGTGRLQVSPPVTVTDDTHITFNGYDIQVDLASGLTVYKQPSDITDLFYPGWWGMNGGAGNNSWNYYGVTQALYREHYRTGLTEYLTAARAVADYWWQYAIDHGRASLAPRAVDLQGQFLRALDGHSERFPDLLLLAQYYNGGNDFNRPDLATTDMREAGYSQGMLALGAIADPDATRHTTYCSALATKAAVWVSSQNVDGSWHENLFLISGLGVGGGYVSDVSVSPWRQAIAIRGLQQSYEALADTTAAGCNDPTLAASVLAAIEAALDFTVDYGISSTNDSPFYSVLSPSDEQTSTVRAGTVSVALSSTTVTGVGTSFLTHYPVGYFIGFDNSKTVYEVASRASDTSMTLTAAYGTRGEGSSAVATTHSSAAPASTNCGTSLAGHCVSPYSTLPAGDINLARTLPGMFGWGCYYIDSSYCDWGDRFFGRAFGGPGDGPGGVAACAGPHCSSTNTDWMGALHSCVADATLPCNPDSNYAQGNTFSYLGKNFGEGNGTPNAQAHLAYRLMGSPAPPETFRPAFGAAVFSGKVTR